jgi:hemin uptake protein HemP
LKPSIAESRKDDNGADGAPVVSSRDLLGEGREVIILHGRDRYRLFLTKSNKLILTK